MKKKKIIVLCLLAAAIVSFMPLLRGLENYSITGLAISVVLLLVFIVLQLKSCKNNELPER